MDLDRNGDDRPARSSSHVGLSLWLVPSSNSERTIWRNEMSALRQAVLRDDHDQRMNPSAPFPPHVTLLSSLDDAERWTEEVVWNTLVAAIGAWHQQGGKPLTCGLADVATHHTYFQCIFVALQKTQALMDLNMRMRDAFDAHQQPPYVPHCSLLYAHLTPHDTGKRIAKLKREGVFASLFGDTVAAARNRSSTPEDAMSASISSSSSSALAEAAQLIVLGRSRSKDLARAAAHIDAITLDAIELWDTNGEVDRWRMLRRMPL